LNYIDTNVIISFLNNRDINHEKALKTLNHDSEMVTSPVAILELKSVLCRTTTLNTDEIEAFVDYLHEINIEVPMIDMNKVISNAIEIAVNIRMKTLDILHLATGVVLNVDDFITFDREFIEKKKEIENIGLRVKS
jgi:predicted nucleic acid-binding protein